MLAMVVVMVVKAMVDLMALRVTINKMHVT